MLLLDKEWLEAVKMIYKLAWGAARNAQISGTGKAVLHDLDLREAVWEKKASVYLICLLWSLDLV